MDGICKPISGCTHPMFHWLRIFTRNGASRRPLISKRGNKDFYKGNQTGSTGKIDKYSNFRPDPKKIRQFCIPSATELANFEANTYPYVYPNTPRFKKEEVINTVEKYLKAARGY